MTRTLDIYTEQERWRRDAAFAALSAAVSAAGYDATGFAYHATTGIYTVFVSSGKRLTDATLTRAFASSGWKPCGHGRQGDDWFMMLVAERVA